MAESGLVEAVTADEIQTHLTANAAAGATVLTVESTEQFDPAGGQLSISDRDPIDYLTCDDTTITLAAGLDASADDGEPVTLVLGGQRATMWLAEVSFGEEETVPVPIGFEQRAMWPAGPYDPPVPVVVSDDLSRIVDTPGRTPVISDTEIVTTAEGARVRLATETNVYESGLNWGIIQLFGSDPSWSPAQMWGVIVDGSPDDGSLVLASPFLGSDFDQAATITLQSDATGASSMKFKADTFLVGDGATSTDFNLLPGADQYSLRNAGGDRLNVGFNIGYVNLVSRNGAAALSRLDLQGTQIRMKPGGASDDVMFVKALAVDLPMLVSGNLNSGIAFETAGGLRFTDGSGTTWIQTKALVHTDMSDRRYKTNIAPVTDALDTIEAVHAIDYDNSAGGDGRRGRGFIAQDLAERVEHLTLGDGSEDDPMSVSPYGVAATAWAGVSELHALVKEQAAQIAALEKRVAALEA